MWRLNGLYRARSVLQTIKAMAGKGAFHGALACRGLPAYLVVQFYSEAEVGRHFLDQ